MSILSAAQQVELHREVYAAIIRSCLPYGKLASFAEQLGISRQHLSYILVVDLDPDRVTDTRRTASEALARRLADALPLPLEKRTQVLEHMLAAREAQEATRRVARSATDRPVELVDEIRHALHKATHTLGPAEAQQSYRSVVRAGRELFPQVSARDIPLAFVELCFCLHDALCVLDDHAQALFYARHAEACLAQLPALVERRSPERVAYMRLNVLRALGVAYKNLNQARTASDFYRSAEATEGFARQPAFWIPHLVRDRLSALNEQPGFRLRQVDELVEHAWRLGDDDMPCVLRFLLHVRRGVCYTTYGSLDKAERFLVPQHDQLDRIPGLGNLHRVLYLRSLVQLRARQGDDIGFADRLAQLLRLTAAAGLAHQRRVIEREFGVRCMSEGA